MPVLAAIPAILGGVSAATGIAGAVQQGKAAKRAAAVAQQEVDLKKQIIAAIMPFAQQLLALGLDPAKILSSPLGAALLAPGKQAIAGESEAARRNLIEQFARSGISPGAGVAAGPLANISSQEALAIANLIQQLPLQAIGLGQMGAGILQGIPTNPVGAAGMAGQLAGQGMFNFGGAFGGLAEQLSKILASSRPQPTPPIVQNRPWDLPPIALPPILQGFGR